MSTHPRLLPWSGPSGQPCHLVSDEGGNGYLSRMADEIEAVQLGMGNQLLGHAGELLADRKAGAGELRDLAHRLCEALRDALRVADSRGRRLPAPADMDESDD